MHSAPPIVWSIAGLDTAGGAGLSADQRAADAFGVHLCPVAAALTAQHSCGVEAVWPVPQVQLSSQLEALAEDMPPCVIKTGLLGSVAAVRLVAQWVDHLRARTPPGQDPHRHLALVVDPVLGATAAGPAFATADVQQAYREWLLPRTTVLTPNRQEARRLLQRPGGHDGPRDELPELASALRAMGARSVVITGGDAPSEVPGHEHGHAEQRWCLDWLDTPQAQGWLCAPRIEAPHHHGTGCTFASGVAAAWALGHVDADAIVLAQMLTRSALRQGHPAGRGAGPVQARAGFAAGPACGGVSLPWLGLGTALPWQLTVGLSMGKGDVHQHPASPAPPLFAAFAPPSDGLYGILPNAILLRSALKAGLRCVQLRLKTPPPSLDPHPLQTSHQRDTHIAASVDAAAQAGAQLFVNDHWRAALALPEPAGTVAGFRLGIHLGQEDLLALSPADQAALLVQRSRLMLGLSSHSLWELARAAGCGASLIACGPVQATTTKAMPWRPQGTHNLRWWLGHSPAPVVAIGGLLTPHDVQAFASCAPAAVCVVRALGDDDTAMQHAVPGLRQAFAQGRAQPTQAWACDPDLPHPVL